MNTKNMRLLRDDIAGIIFTSEDCREYLISIISAALDIDADIIRAGLVLTRVNSNINTKYSMVDAIYENKTSIINIEINYKDSLVVI